MFAGLWPSCERRPLASAPLFAERKKAAAELWKRKERASWQKLAQLSCASQVQSQLGARKPLSQPHSCKPTNEREEDSLSLFLF